MHKKIILAIILTIFLLPMVLSLEWDNQKVYEPATNTITFRNSFLFIPTNEIAKAKLDTPQVFNVIRGKDRLVWQTTIDSYTDYEEFIKGYELIDLNRGMKIERDLKFRYATWEDYQEPVFKTVCVKAENLNKQLVDSCSGVIDHYETKKRIVWNNMEKMDIQKGKITIGVFADVLPGDKIEFYPNLFGLKVTEWSVWQESYNTGLMSYYRLNNTGVDEVSANNLAPAGTPVFINSGIIGQAHGGVDGSNYYKIPTAAHPDNNGTINFWLNRTSMADGNAILMADDDNNNDGDMYTGNTGKITWQTAAGDVASATNMIFADSVWRMITITFNSTTVKYYVNGTFYTEVLADNKYMSADNWYLGRDSGSSSQNNRYDELSFWNYTLDDASILAIYNSGTGMTYDPFTAPTMKAVASYPKMFYNSSSSTVGIGCNFTAQYQNITKVLLNVTGASDNSLAYTNTETITETKSYNKTWTTGIIADGKYNWSCIGYGDFGKNATNSSWRFDIDTTDPYVYIAHPSGNLGAADNPQKVSLNFTLTEAHLDSCWYSLNGAANVSLTGCANVTLTLTNPTASNSVRVYANDTLGHINSTISSFSFSSIVNNNSYTNISYETESLPYLLNVSVDSAVLGAIGSLIYNGTAKDASASCYSNTCIFTAQVDTPLITLETEKKNIYWNYTIVTGTSTVFGNTTSKVQTVNMTHFELCNATYTTPSINFSFFSQTTLDPINVETFNGLFTYYLGGGNIKKNTTINLVNTTAGLPSVSLCIIPNKTFTIDASLLFGNTSYVTNSYFIDSDSFNEAVTAIPLYLLETTSATTFIQWVRDIGRNNVPNAYIYIQRCYAGDADCKTVQISKTDSNGKSVGFYKTETIFYKHYITKDGAIVYTEDPRKIFGETVPYTLYFYTGNQSEVPWTNFNNLTSLTSSIVASVNNTMLTFFWLDSSALFINASLIVSQENWTGGDRVICTNTSAISSGSVVCNITGYTGSFIAKGYIARGSSNYLVNLIRVTINGAKEIFGKEGLFLGWFILLIAATAFFLNPIAGIWVVTVVAFLLNLIGLITLAPLILFGLLGLAVVLTWLLKD